MKKRTNQSNILLITHNDLDGIGAFCLLKTRFPKAFIKMHMCGYDGQYAVNTIVENYLNDGSIFDYDELIITDISVNNEVSERLDSIYKSGKMPIKLYDHHDTAMELDKYEWCTVSKTLEGSETCGTELFAYNELGAMNVSEYSFVKAITSYDTWNWKNKPNVYSDLAVNLNKLFYYFGGFKFAEEIIPVLSNDRGVLSEKHELIIEILQSQEQRGIKSYLKNVQVETVPVSDVRIGFVYAEDFISELGNVMCSTNDYLETPLCDIACIINANTGKCSLRTVDHNLLPLIDELRKNGFTAGGHIKSGGFTMPYIECSSLTSIKSTINKFMIKAKCYH